jgi:hypothetical protein
MQVKQLQKEIEALSDEEYIRLRQWFAEKDWERWDGQIEADAESGKLDFLIEEARTAKKRENLKGL